MSTQGKLISCSSTCVRPAFLAEWLSLDSWFRHLPYCVPPCFTQGSEPTDVSLWLSGVGVDDCLGSQDPSDLSLQWRECTCHCYPRSISEVVWALPVKTCRPSLYCTAVLRIPRWGLCSVRMQGSCLGPRNALTLYFPDCSYNPPKP